MAGMSSRTPEKMLHVTSSAAIAPGCLSAQWGKEERQGRERVGAGTRVGKRYRDMGFVEPEGKSLRQQ